MPLRDHFHPPVSLRHTWDELHGQWPAMIVLQLAPQLPANYAAAPQIHLGGAVEIDVATYEQVGNGDAVTANGNGGVATAQWTATEPTLRVEAELPEMDEYEVRVYDTERGRTLVAAIELVSPSNKDRPETRQAFVTKCAALLRQKVSITIVDLVTSREANLYAQLLEFIGQKDKSVSVPPSAIYAAACRWTLPQKKWLFEAWHRSLSVGQPLPTLPVWLADDLAITLNLEASYEATCHVLRIA
jgi:hypothetical protein